MRVKLRSKLKKSMYTVQRREQEKNLRETFEVNEKLRREGREGRMQDTSLIVVDA